MQTRKITNSFLSEKDDVSTMVIGAEVKFAAFLLEHNLPIAAADHAGPLFRSMFPDSRIASYYGSARTKTTSIINKALAPEFASSVIDMVQKQPFTLSLDGSNEQEQKLVPLTVRVASFPGPAQLSVTISTVKRERAWYLFSHDVRIERMVQRV